VPSAAPSRQDSSASPISSISGTGSLGSVGSAASIEGTLRLTPAEQNRAGAAWYQEPVVVANGFTADFTFLLGGFVGDGGDGLALVVQTAGPDALGGLGAHLGYGGLANSLAVEFDTHFNAWPGLDDPNDNHVAVQTRGTEPNTGDHIASLVLDGDILDLSDGTPHRIVVTYRPGGLAVIIDGGDPLQAVLDITTTLELLEGGRAYIGFTASTGDTGQFTDLLALEITFP
jgi:hypothetical protein